MLRADGLSLEKAADLLKKSEIVAVPTETVYGLAANSLDTEAVARIFAAKGRPQDNPLISHICDMEMLEAIADGISPLARRLAERFWPGSLTMIFGRKPIMPVQTCGGLDTVAVRMPANTWTLSLIEKCGFPLAAPSANTSGLPSPTTAQHVMADMNGKIPMIIDGGECSCGVESTVICFIGDKIRILRPGAVTAEMLGEFAETEIDQAVLCKLESGARAISPGMKYKHYSPRAEVVAVDTDSDDDFDKYVMSNSDGKTVVLGFGEDFHGLSALPYGASSEEQAEHLFDSLRRADEMGFTKVIVRAPSKAGIGLAVYNRLIRAAAFNVVYLGTSGERK